MAGRRPKLTPRGFLFAGHSAMEAGTFEPFEATFIADNARRARALIDVGANAGYFACIARREGQHVIAVEPLSANVQLLMTNVASNGWDDIEVVPVGLSAKPGFAELYGGGTGASLIENWSGTSSVWRRLVPVTTLDILLAGRFPGDRLLIKIDVEGAELDVLKGATETLRRLPAPLWLVEINLTEHHPSGLNPAFVEVFRLFWQHGYACSTADEERRIVTDDDIQRWVAHRQRDFGNINYIFEKS